MSQRYPMTPSGYARMKKQLDHLKRVERPGISAAIEEARAHGDLKENAEYHAAKEKQGLIEAKIRELDAKVSLAQVVDPTKLSGNRVSFGATVRLLETGSDEEVTYAIVGADEADLRYGLINYLSPIAAGLMGKEEGDEAKIRTDAGTRTFEILAVEFRDIVIPEQQGGIV
jgi:transcription elongation factor GreA